ncbi:MAG: C40 family peptidase [Eubacteriales bacterium]|nr:C40 family peptidase [Eubacteriales bacterium]
MKKKLITFIFTLAIFAAAGPQTVFAGKADTSGSAAARSGSAGQTGSSVSAFSDRSGTSNAGDMFSDGTQEGDISALANELVKRTEEEAQKYQKEQEAAKRAAEEKEARRKAEEKKRKAEEAKKKAEEEKRKAEEEARIAAQKAEEERLAKRQEIVDFALQFEGNPYVYGGTSLTNGADCSGFVMSVFQEFGYELPRVAAAQCDASAKKDVKDIEPGDLVFYGDYGIDHVALYIGGGQIIHASTSATGIKISDYDYRQPTAVGTYVE